MHLIDAACLLATVGVTAGLTTPRGNILLVSLGVGGGLVKVEHPRDKLDVTDCRGDDNDGGQCEDIDVIVDVIQSSALPLSSMLADALVDDVASGSGSFACISHSE